MGTWILNLAPMALEGSEWIRTRVWAPGTMVKRVTWRKHHCCLEEKCSRACETKTVQRAGVPRVTRGSLCWVGELSLDTNLEFWGHNGMILGTILSSPSFGIKETEVLGREWLAQGLVSITMAARCRSSLRCTYAHLPLRP